MAMNPFRSGYEVLQYEIAEERAAALARLGQRLETALAALAECPRGSDRSIRRGLIEQAGYALWLFVVQREALGLRDSRQIMRDYRVPAEVQNRMGLLPGKAAR